MATKHNAFSTIKMITLIMAIGFLSGLGVAAHALSQDISVDRVSDDAEESVSSGSVNTSSSDLELIGDGSNDQIIGIRFNGASIDPGSTITDAYIQFTCDEVKNNDPCNLVIRGEASDDASTFSETSQNISLRPTTTAFVNWSPPVWLSVGEAGLDQRTPDLSAIIQEIVDRAGWYDGNSLALIISGTGTRTAEAYSGGEPLLHVEWRLHDYEVGFTLASSGGPEEASPVVLEVTLDPAAPTATVTVDYTTVDGAASAAGSDYVAASGTLTFAPNDTSESISITILDDGAQEPAEDFGVTLSNVTNDGGLDVGLGGITEHTYWIAASDQPLDWPMWRYDANRSAASPNGLPSTLYLQWVLELPPLEPAWPAGDGAVTGTEDLAVEDGKARRMTFDIAYAPVVVGETMFVGSSFDGSLRAYDTETAAEQWCFFAEGPIRFAPAVVDGKVYFVSDDGYLYCLDAATGDLNWRYRGGPSNRKVLGNKRLGSTWPARGGPVVKEGTVYFAAGIWPFMGVFIYALDADTGDLIWINDGSGSIFMLSPHSGAYAFNAIAPQGHLAAIDDKLLVPNGRAVAAALDRATGDLLYYEFGANNRNGTAYAAAIADYFSNSCKLFNLSNGSQVGGLIDGAVLTQSTIYAMNENDIKALATSDLSELWSYPAAGVTVLCKAGDWLYAGVTDEVLAIEDLGGSYVLRWQETILGTPANMLAADDKLIVATEEGYIYCFGEVDTGVGLPSGGTDPIDWPPEDGWTVQAQAILDEAGQDEGYCLVLGVGTGRLMEELARLSGLLVIGLDPDTAKVETLRAHWADDIGVSAERLSVIVGDICSLQLPSYLANLITSEDIDSAGTGNGDEFVEKVFYSLRPYGGQACFSSDLEALFNQGVAARGLEVADVRRSGVYTILERVGALPDSADWTHQYADAANTVVSKDKLVKAPLGLLWYGGSSNKQILPRHRHGPSPQVVDGRLFIEGPDIMRAVDVYTGRVLWEAGPAGVGDHFVERPIIRANESHEPGANHIGSNYATADDGVYVAYGTDVLRLDPATGQALSTFPMPGGAVCTQVKIWENLLVLAVDPVIYDGQLIGEDNWNATGGQNLVVMDRYSGSIEWQRPAVKGFHHNAIIVGNDILFCIDRLAPGYEKMLARRGMTTKDIGVAYTLLALNVYTGGEVWSITSEDIFGTWLSYSEEHGILVQSGRDSEDMVLGEPTGRIITYQGADGAVQWDSDVTGVAAERGPLLIHGDTLYMQEDDYFTSGALGLLTGEVRMRTHPLTSESVAWRFVRNKGCGTQVACEYLMTFRSGTGAYYDLTNNGGVGSIGGMKSGCTSNLIPANGVLNAPDYTRTCNCSYQMQTSLALVYMPEVEEWTNFSASDPTAPIDRAGINFGAYGDRVADNGTLWMDYPPPSYGVTPSDGDTYPNLVVQTTPAAPELFRHHSSRFQCDDGRPWVSSSGAVGLTDVMVTLGNSQARVYRVQLYFAEPEGAQVGERVFDVSIQGQPVLTDFDVAELAGSDGDGIMKAFTNITAQDTLTVTLTPAGSKQLSDPVLSGIEFVADRDVDGLGDAEEEDYYGTDPDVADTDSDGVDDGEEVHTYATDPNDDDSDDDGINDGTEVNLGTDPNDQQDFPSLSEVWVDFTFTVGTELGTSSQPFNSLAEGLISVQTGGTVKIKGNTGDNTTDESPRITKAMRLEAVGAAVWIGVQGGGGKAQFRPSPGGEEALAVAGLPGAAPSALGRDSAAGDDHEESQAGTSPLAGTESLDSADVKALPLMNLTGRVAFVALLALAGVVVILRRRRSL